MKHKSQLWKNLRLPLKRTAAMMLALAIVFTSMSVIIPSAWADEEVPAAAESAPTPAPEPAPAPTPTPAPEPTPEPAPAPETSNSDTVKDEGTEETTPDETPEENKTCEITVTVKDGTGSAVSGATVNGKTTDGDGKATLKVSKTGSYTLKASKSGYYDGSETIDASGDTATGTVVMDKKVEYYGKVKLQNAEGDPINADAGDYKVKYTYKGNTSTIPDSDKSGSVYHFTMRQNKSYTLKVEAANSKKYKDADAKTIDISADMKPDTAAETVLKLQTYSVSVGDHVSIVEGKKDSYHYGDKLTVKFDERAGYQLTGVSGGDFSKVKDNKLEITVEGDTKVEAAYTKLYQVSVTCGENGGVKINDKSVATGGTVEVLDGDKPSYEVKADNGYYIYSLKVGGETVVEADESKTHGASSKSGTFSAISGDTTIEAAFAETKYEVTVSVGNEVEDSGIVLTDSKNADNAIQAGSSKTITVDKSYLGESGYAINLKVSALEGYAVNYGDEQYVNGDTLTIKVTEDTSVALSIQERNYLVKYHNPFAANRTDNYTIGTSSFTPKSDSGASEEKGFELKGWSSQINGEVEVTDGASLKAWLAEQNDVQESYDLYAVYELTDEYTLSINGVDVSEKAVTLEGWNSEDVSLTATSKQTGTVTADPAEISAPAETAGKKTIKTNITVTKKNGDDTYEWNYGEVSVTAQFDTEVPVLTVTKGEDESYSAEADDGEGSGVEVKKVSYAVLDDLSKKTDASEWEQGTSYAMTEEDAGETLLFRAQDNAGNVGYAIAVLGDEALKEKDAPEVIITPEGTSYTNENEMTYTITASDAHLAMDKSYEIAVEGASIQEGSKKVSGRTDGYFTKYEATYVVDTSENGETEVSAVAEDIIGNASEKTTATVVADHDAPKVTYSYKNKDGSGELTDALRTNKDTTITVTVEDENLNPDSITVTGADVIYDKKSTETKWVGTVTLSEEDSYNLNVTASDKAGNTSTKDAEVVIAKTKPTVKVTYSYTDADGEKSGKTCPSTKTIYSSGTITASITVEESGESMLETVTVNGTDNDDGVVWTKSEDNSKWTTNVVLGSGVEDSKSYTLKVSAEDDAGNDAAYTSGTLVVEKIKPEVSDNVSEVTTEQSEKLWLRMNQAVTFTAKDEDDGSGMKSVQVMLNGTKLKSGESERTIQYDNAAWVTGENTITVTATDKAGNVSDEKSYKIYKDVEAPDIEQISLQKPSPSENGPIYQIFFGHFFNKSARIVIDVKDLPTEANSGVQEVTVDLNGSYKTKNGRKETISKTCKASLDDKGQYYIKLPEDLSEENLAYMNVKVTVTAKDNVGNTVSQKNVKFDRNTNVLYESSAPEISIDKNKSTLYEESDKSLWIKKDGEVTFTAKDVKLGMYESGLASMEVKVGEKTFTGTGSASSQSVTVKDTVLASGANEITVSAKDNAGNETEENFTIYRDDKVPTVTGLTLSGTGTNQSYGCFYSSDVKAEVTVQDAEYSSGIASVVVNYGEDPVEDFDLSIEEFTKEAVEKSVVYTIKYQDNTAAPLSITVTDNAGNSATYSGEALNELMGGKNLLMFEKTAPKSDLTFAERDNGYSKCSDGKQWYSDYDIKVEATVTDPDSVDGNNVKVSGLKEVKFALNGKDISPELTKKANWAGNLTKEANYSFNLKDYADKMSSGENTIQITAKDNAKNEHSSEYKFYVDDMNPVISEISFAKNVGDEDDEKKNLNDDGYSANIKNFATQDEETVNKQGEFAYFFNQTTTATVTVDDTVGEKPASSGVKQVTLRAVAAKDSPVSADKVSKTVRINTDCSLKKKTEEAEFTIPANFKGWIYVYAEDNVGFTSTEDTADMSKWTSLNGQIVETQDHHKDEPYQHVAISVSGNNTYTFGDGTKLYSNDVNVSFTVKDTYNGISRIEYSVESKEDDKTPDGDVSFSRSDGNKSGWSVKKDSSTTAQSFISQATKTITVSNESNNIKINLKMWDGSGNTSTDTITFHIDKTAPKIEVTMDQNDDPTYTGYFKTTRTGTIKITDRNFDPSKVKFSVTRDGGGFSVGSKFNGSGTRSATDGEKTYTMPLTFEPDGDYLFGVSCTDLANNTTGDSGVKYDDRGTDTKFTVDKTAPVITVDISGNRGKGNYYNQTATVTVTVHEHNYASERYTDSWTTLDSQTRAPSGSAPGDGAGGGGDVWTHTYSCNQELIYALNSLKVIDKAGNETTTAGGSYALGTEFIVDQSDPDFKLYTGSDKSKDLDHTATNEKTAAPVVIIHDTNLDTTDPGSYSVKLTGVQEHAGKEPGTNLIGEAGYTISTNANDNRTLQVNLGNLGENMTSDNIEKADDIYTLTVEATDKAGRTSNKTAVFSLNRYGSTYMVNTDTQALLERYYSNQEQPIQIIQINAASISDQKLSMSKDSQTTKLAEGRDYTMTYNQPEGSSESGWYECIYDIGQTLFEQEATYAVDVSSNDHAKNTLNNAISKRTINLFDGKNWKSDRVNEEGEAVAAPVNFRIDKTKPDAGMQDTKKQYHSGSENIEIYASDDAMLDYVQVLVDEQPYVIEELNGIVSDPTKIPAEYLEDGSYTVNLKFSDSDKHRVKVVSFDKAGNNSEMEVDHTIQITTNLFRLWLGNPFAVILTIAAVLAVIALIYRKMKKNGGSEAAA